MPALSAPSALDMQQPRSDIRDLRGENGRPHHDSGGILPHELLDGAVTRGSTQRGFSDGGGTVAASYRGTTASGIGDD